MSHYWRFLIIVCLLGAPGVGAAERRALLIGVNSYPNLPDYLQLQGPANDVELVGKVLLNYGFRSSDITILSETDGSRAPTRKNILQALNSLVEESQAGDFTYLHFAGHGSRQPVKLPGQDQTVDNTEPDGLDELFLPSDVDHWNDYIGAVDNAITDNEIAAYLDRIRARGADVWIVFDSCHSGTMTRGGGFDVTYRRVDEQVLGIPLERGGQPPVTSAEPDKLRGNSRGKPAEGDFEFTASNNGNPGGAPVTPGDLIAFSAAQPIQTTPEMRLPANDADADSHGLFSYMLMQALNRHPGLTYRQLGQLVLQSYSAMNWVDSQPLISGTALDKTVFGEAPQGVNLWLAQADDAGLRINAGRLHGLSRQATLSVFSNPEASEDSYIGEVEVRQANALQAQAAWFIPPSASTDGLTHYFVKLKVPGTPLALGAAVVAARTLSGQQQDRLQQGLEASATTNPLISLATTGQTDLRITHFDNALWLLLPGQSLPCDQQVHDYASPAECSAQRKPQDLLNIPLALTASTPQTVINAAVGEALTRLARGQNLIRVSETMDLLSDTNEQPIKVDLLFRKANDKLADDWRPFPQTGYASFTEGDQIRAVVTSQSRIPQDVSVLYKDSHFEIAQVYPQPGEANRLRKDQSVKFLWTINVKTTGLEDLIVLNQEGKGPTTDFAFLQQPPLGMTTRSERRRGVPDTATGSINPLAALMDTVLIADETARQSLRRGLEDPLSPAPGEMQMFRWRVEK